MSDLNYHIFAYIFYRKRESRENKFRHESHILYPKHTEISIILCKIEPVAEYL